MLITMETLFTLLLEHPRAVMESGVAIPCALHGLIEREDDEAIRIIPRWAPVEALRPTTRVS